ncbi:hypothetical protein CBR_g28518 [Chara braunii]|uniref:C2 domain-containing protein n=1 Tax=Chara braunii TaxID=69332 RepID=A0A388JWE2_CHABU|nr:hypothetical protein CBR_g28518 [Chara braunii]|eukprot:GBG62042.1 hypothetical protein CBR_g28518 [Chara braunii]
MGVSPSLFQCLRFLDCTSMEEVAKRHLGRVLKNGEFISRNAQEAIALFDVLVDGNIMVQSFLTDLFLKADNLCEPDQQSTCNPFVVVSLKSEKESIWREVARTEIVFGSACPQWLTPIRISYRFEQVQKLRFSMFNAHPSVKDPADSDVLELEEHAFLGATECCLCEMVVSAEKSKTLQVDLRSQGGRTESLTPAGDAQCGSLTVSAEKVLMSNAQVEMTLACRGLADRKKSDGNTSHPFLMISRASDGEEYMGVYKTEVVMNNSVNPTWMPIHIPLQQLCNGDVDQPLLIECFDFEPDEVDGPQYDLIGQVLVPFRSLQDVSGTGEGFELERPPNQQNYSNTKAPKIIGKVFCLSLRLENEPSFLDYIFGGCEIGFMVSIDFTSSNGPPESPMSLHYLDPGTKLNPYQAVISSVGKVVDFYNANKVYCAYGFGALVGIGTISHCFNLNGQATCPEVSGVKGILDAYQTSLQNVTLAGPTLLAPTIREAMRVVSQSSPMGAVGPAYQREQKYHILLVVLDGVINDMEATWNALEEASQLPLSVVIAGVGDADFSSMEVLNEENRHSRTRQSEGRNITRFVAMNQMADSDIMLASELLCDLPDHLVEFMRMRGIVPNQPTTAVSAEEIAHVNADV